MIEFQPGSDGFSLTGELNYDNAGAVMSAGSTRISECSGDVTLDLAAVTSKVGSLVVAVMLAWIRHAANADVALHYTSVPSPILRIIRFSGLEDTVPLAAPPSA